MLIKKSKQAIQFVKSIFQDDRSAPVSLHRTSIHGVKYYDLKEYKYPSYSLISRMIEMSQKWMKNGIELKFINVSGSIKSQIRLLGLDDVLICE